MKKLSTGVRILNPCMSFVFLDATVYAMAPNTHTHTHTERIVIPTSSPMAIAEYIAAFDQSLNDVGWSYRGIESKW